MRFGEAMKAFDSARDVFRQSSHGFQVNANANQFKSDSIEK